MIDRGIKSFVGMLRSGSRLRIYTQEWDVYKIVSVCFGFKGDIAVPVDSAWIWVWMDG